MRAGKWSPKIIENNDMQRVSSNEKTGFHSKVSMKELPKIFHDIWWFFVTFDDSCWFFRINSRDLSWLVMIYHDWSWQITILLGEVGYISLALISCLEFLYQLSNMIAVKSEINNLTLKWATLLGIEQIPSIYLDSLGFWISYLEFGLGT